MTRLSVNLNKVALLRNSRHTGVPDVLRFAAIAHDAGADGLTVHPRPDERHIRAADVPALAALMQPWRPAMELNIEGYPDARLIDIVRAARPEQCTLVPDPPDAFTSEAGWRFGSEEIALLRPAIAAIKAAGSSCSSIPTVRISTGCAAPAPTASRSIPAPMPRRSAPATRRRRSPIAWRRRGGRSTRGWWSMSGTI